jgi:adsorption protein B
LPLDPRISAFLIPLAAWMLVSGLDDLFITVIYFIHSLRRFPWPSKLDLDSASQRSIAILLPLWREHSVIGQMLERNLASIEYGNYEIFVGVYPNDEATGRVVRELAARHSRIHVSVCPHDGPTSKGDCLNWIFVRMRTYEAQTGRQFEIIMTHDAEDLIHAESLRLVNWFSREFAMVQVPVLPLATGVSEFTHGLYCDEFGEYQSKDIPVRQWLGGFLPSNGVGTGFARDALERLAESRGGRLFDPQCLTEDYDNGFRLYALGFRQIFLPLRFDAASLTATREYFPRRLRAAIRQRSRWVAGIVLQGWQHFGWRAPLGQLYWFWRDRKGLVGNLLTPLANLLLFVTAGARLLGKPWSLFAQGAGIGRWMTQCFVVTMGMALLQMAVRIRCCARIYGWRFALTVPLRLPWGSLVNSTATLAAIRQFLQARTRRQPVAWLKTDHVYPSAVAAIPSGRPKLGDVLVRMRAVPMSAIQDALVSGRNGMRLGEYLVEVRQLSEDALYQALSCQAGLPFGTPAHEEVSSRVARILPAGVARRWRVMPFRLEIGQLHLVSPELPTEPMIRELSAWTDLELRFHLVKPKEFELLAERYLETPGGSPQITL